MKKIILEEKLNTDVQKHTRELVQKKKKIHRNRLTNYLKSSHTHNILQDKGYIYNYKYIFKTIYYLKNSVLIEK